RPTAVCSLPRVTRPSSPRRRCDSPADPLAPLPSPGSEIWDLGPSTPRRPRRHTGCVAGSPGAGVSLLLADGVEKIYRTTASEVPALRSVDLRIDEGEFVAVMGPSGSGKTPLLNCLSGLDDIDGGHVYLDGVDLHSLSDADRTRNRASQMGFVFQQFNLIPVLRAVENLALPLLLAGVHGKEARRRAGETLERVGLGHRVGHRPSELSGGEQQRT